MTGNVQEVKIALGEIGADTKIWLNDQEVKNLLSFSVEGRCDGTTFVTLKFRASTYIAGKARVIRKVNNGL